MALPRGYRHAVGALLLLLELAYADEALHRRGAP